MAVLYPNLCYSKVCYIGAALHIHLSYDVASGSEIMPCNKIDKPQVVNFTDFQETL